ncbi:MAG: ATPase [Desulfosarcina sp.]|nr:ATPase [Desulfobacterales bacterium]
MLSATNNPNVENRRALADDLKRTLNKQRLYGGRIESNLQKSGQLSESGLSAFFNFFPSVPKNIAETKLNTNFLSDLILKHSLVKKNFTIPELVRTVMLCQSIIAECVDYLRNDKLIEIRSTNKAFALINSEYRITEAGISRAAHLLEENRYIGPAPVVLEDYNAAVELQTISHIGLDKARLKESFSDIVISEDKLHTFGAAINSGKPIFLYGPSGNGKSTVAAAMGDAIPGDVFIPHAIIAGGQIIVMYDEINHSTADHDPETGPYDQRWIKIKRPVIFAGGELTLKSLDLELNPTTKYYEAPLQVKANNGIFVVDDFGRQLIDPQILLNRWIVPLENRADFLTLSTGLKFEVPFDQLVIFATNISPKQLADEAFLRRLRYKIYMGSPSQEEFKNIFTAVCRYHQLAYDQRSFEHLLSNYKKFNIRLNGCHPRDLIDHIIDEAHFSQKPPVLSPAAIDKAWKNYFVDHSL